MLILAYYRYREIPEEERRIPGFIAGLVDVTLVFGALHLIGGAL